MYESYTAEEKSIISNQIKPIDSIDLHNDWHELIKIRNNDLKCSSRCRTGLKVVDYFTFQERLHTKGKYNVNYFEFISNIDHFKKKRFIHNMLIYYEKNTKQKNIFVLYKNVFNICLSAINAFRPIIAMEMYARFKPKCVLDFCTGWGGRLVGACAMNVQKFIGIDINTNLLVPYHKLTNFLEQNSNTEIQIHLKNALEVDYSQMVYDMVFTSPPYYFIEKYSNNDKYENKKSKMREEFYIPLFEKTFRYLQPGGNFCLNVNHAIYEEICLPMFGEPNHKIPLKKSQRQNDYSEFIYVWKKIDVC